MVFTQQQAETELQSNLKEGRVLSLSLQLPVAKARAVLRHDTESDIRALWEHILEGFDLWKLERGSRNIKPAGLLSPVIEFDAAPAYLCTEYGASVEGWGSFFFKLLSDEYYPITHLVEHLSIEIILSVLILVEASEGRVDQVRLLYDRLTLSMESENFRQRQELLDKYLELIPTASKGRKFVSGRRKGALKETNLYLLSLVERFPNLNGKELFRIACEEAESERMSPFQFDHADGGILLDGDVEIGLDKFLDRLSKAKNRHMR